MSAMTRKTKCVECRHCRMRVDPTKGARHYCARKKKSLPVDLSARPSCESFALPKVSGHWGP
ncbi:MAG: hypothetical protein ACHQ49_12385 [Elusimicrobiota bacterium]